MIVITTLLMSVSRITDLVFSIMFISGFLNNSFWYGFYSEKLFETYSNLLLCINNCFQFFIYYLFNKSFKLSFIQMIDYFKSKTTKR